MVKGVTKGLLYRPHGHGQQYGDWLGEGGAGAGEVGEGEKKQEQL